MTTYMETSPRWVQRHRSTQASYLAATAGDPQAIVRHLNMLGNAIAAEAEEEYPSPIGIRILARVILEEADKLAIAREAGF